MSEERTDYTLIILGEANRQVVFRYSLTVALTVPLKEKPQERMNLEALRMLHERLGREISAREKYEAFTSEGTPGGKTADEGVSDKRGDGPLSSNPGPRGEK